MKLRPYQERVIEGANEAIAAGWRRIVIVAPTGAGKTVIACESIARAIEAGGSVLFLAHRRELVKQAAEKLFKFGIYAGIIQAGFDPSPQRPAQVASVQTLHARAIRSSKIDLPKADMVIVDEAHHVRARTWREILDAYPDAVVLGLTATPCRGDGRGLGNVFDVMVECPAVADLIKAGYLVPTRVYAPTRPDLSGVQTRRGDYVERQLAERMDQAQLVGDVVTHWHRLAENRRTVVFASGVAHSIHLRDEFRKSGVAAEHIDAKTPKDERDRILAQLAAGNARAVCNAMVLTEGWDQPEVACAVLARPTKHMGLYRQMVGRVLRPAPGKDHALILDHAGTVFEHGFAEDRVIWTLDTDKRAEAPAHKARANDYGSRLTTCPRCDAIRTGGEGCQACGWEPKRRPEHVDVVDADLARIDRRKGPQRGAIDARRWHAELTAIARERGYKPGWVGHKYREKFGEWPPHGYVAPLEPSAEVRSWVRSRAIAWAKSQRAS